MSRKIDFSRGLPNEMKKSDAVGFFDGARFEGIEARVKGEILHWNGRTAAFPPSRMVPRSWLLGMKRTLELPSLVPDR